MNRFSEAVAGGAKMNSYNLAPLLVGFLVLAFTIKSFVQYARLKHFKGPATTGFSRLWLLRILLGGNMHNVFQNVNFKYGRFARIGPNTLLVSDPEFVRKMNAPRSVYHRSDWYKGARFSPNEDTVLSMRDQQVHKALRAKMTPAYNLNKESQNVESCIDTQLATTLNLIKSKYISGAQTGDLRLMDWGKLASYYSIDSITDIAFSQPLGDLEADDDKFDFMKTTEAAVPMIIFFTCFTEAFTILQSKIVVNLLAPTPDDPSPFGRVMGFARKCAKERFGPKKIERKDMLGSFIKNGMGFGEAERTSLLQVIAGSDTVATALRAAVFHLASSPLVVNRMRVEMEAAGIMRDRPTSTIISYAQARSIPYLAAVIQEVLRMHPPVVGAMEKQVGEEGDSIPDGRHVPAGTKLYTSVWGILRDPEAFGPDAELFRPERWLEAVEPEKKRLMDRTADLVFGAGRYVCLGREIAMMQCLKVIPELFYRFDFTIAYPEKPWYSVAFGIFIQHDQWIRVTERPLTPSVPISAKTEGFEKNAARGEIRDDLLAVSASLKC